MLAASKTGEQVPPEPATTAKELVQRRPNRRRRMWTGMGNQEFLVYFSPYMAVKARHSYGPQGHRGISVLIFEATAIGYLEAERLQKYFSEEGRDRDAMKTWTLSTSIHWTGLGNQQLLVYFSPYMAVKAHHSYGPQGHRGISVLIFEATAIGYLGAERLQKHFSEEGRDGDAWERRRALFYQGHKGQLYRYLWTGLGNQELLVYFSPYMAVKVHHSYGPQGHRGISVLIFEATAIGYLGAERLQSHFSKEGRDGDAWERRRALFYQGHKC